MTARWQLVGELLLDRSNFNVMTVYISNPDNLKLMMNLLRDNSRNIQFEAFHVFKVFVANPNKAKPILDILIKNREKLVSFLSAFHNDRQGTPAPAAVAPVHGPESLSVARSGAGTARGGPQTTSSSPRKRRSC